MPDHRISEVVCPRCSYRMDRAANTGRDIEAPKAGDVTVCFRCFCVMVFKPDMSVREMSPVELAREPKEKRLDIARSVEMLKRGRDRLGLGPTSRN